MKSNTTGRMTRNNLHVVLLASTLMLIWGVPMVQSNIKVSTNCSFVEECARDCNNSTCSCVQGFNLEGNREICRLTEHTWKLVFADGDAIGYFENDKNQTRLLLPKTANTTTYDNSIASITYDARNEVVYWIRIYESVEYSSPRTSVYRKSINGNGKFEALLNRGQSNPTFMAFDWITGNIYYYDGGSITVCKNVSTEDCGVIISSVTVTGLVLHPNHGLIFWLTGFKNNIKRAGMDGKNIVAIDTPEMRYPTAIAVDQLSTRLYWFDKNAGTINSADVDGNGWHVIVAGVQAESMDVFGNQIFWSDKNSLKVLEKKITFYYRIITQLPHFQKYKDFLRKVSSSPIFSFLRAPMYSLLEPTRPKS